MPSEACRRIEFHVVDVVVFAFPGLGRAERLVRRARLVAINPNQGPAQAETESGHPHSLCEAQYGTPNELLGGGTPEGT